MEITAQTNRAIGEPADDGRLVRQARAGDSHAFDELAARYSSRLRRVLYGITRDCEAALDAVQEALLRAWRNMHKFERRSQFYTWLTRIGVNEAYRGMSRRSELPLDPHDPTGALAPDQQGGRPEALLESREFLATMSRELRELPEGYRSAVTLRDIEGMTTTEAASSLGIGERAFKSRLHRGRAALRAALAQHLADGYVP